MSLLPGRIYVVVHDEWTPAFSVAGGVLLRPEDNSDSVWVTRRDPAAELYRPTPLCAALQDAVADGTLRVFLRRTVEGFGTHRVLDELDHFGLKRHPVVMIDGAESFFSSVGEVAALQRWAEQRGCTLVLLCGRDEGTDILEALRAVADHLAGFARLRRAGESLWWDTFHWFGRSEFTAQRSFQVEFAADGSALLEESIPAQRAPAPAADEELVLAAAEALGPGETPPARWRMVEEFGALVEASAGARAATAILAFGDHTSVDQLARQVFDLRRTAGPRMKIVVREMRLRLRHNQEQLLLRLGANLVVPAELNFSRLLALVDNVQGQLFTRPLPGDFTAALTDVIPLIGQGYLAPARFAEAVVSTVERSRTVGIHNALVALPLPPGLNAVDALGYCTMTRPGDICTADEENLFLFLFACRETDVDITLGRVFEIPVKELFDQETRTLSADAILRFAGELAARAALLPDFSGEPGTGRVRVPAHPAQPALVEPRAPRPVGCRAERRPLPLRVAQKMELA